MKIVFLAPRYHTNQISLVEYLLKSKHLVSFYVTRIGRSEDHSLLKPDIIKMNFISKLFNFFIRSKNPLFNYYYGIPSIKEMVNFISNKYELIIIRDPISLMGLSYLFLAKLFGTKIIFYIQKEIYNKNSFKIKDIILRFFIRICNEKCISPCLGNMKYKKLIKKINYLPFCLPISIYKKTWFLNNRVNILTVGKFINRKNHLLLIDALLMLKVKTNFQMTIVGECTTDKHSIYLKKVKNVAQKSGLNIEILINIAPKEVKKLYRKHDLFVLPSVNEPASISNLEAMAHGLPVITTDTNKTSCYTEHGINGFIVKSNNVENLSKKLEFLLNNKTKLKKFGNKSFNIVKNKNNPNIIYKNYFENILKI